MVPDSLWEFGFSDVVIFRYLWKGPVNYFEFPEYFGNGFLVCFSFLDFFGNVL
ncbi:Uncharacterized protein M6B38_245170 [Iris pallida]|uniref:Uncharacterized protein n=1 Tax=Iris pallida TaxID=29817 RepID=A0AAX6DIB4_IRIPA|nr:Uncharacterized protein M6B38_245170 [Iris pallida]